MPLTAASLMACLAWSSRLLCSKLRWGGPHGNYVGSGARAIHAARRRLLSDAPPPRDAPREGSIA